MSENQNSDCVWVPASKFAEEFNKTSRTVQRWCHAGFVMSLGYRIRRDVTGHWEIGIPQEEYSKQFRSASIQQSAIIY